MPSFSKITKLSCVYFYALDLYALFVELLLSFVASDVNQLLKNIIQ